MIRRCLALLLFAASAAAHVGSPDVFLEGSAGPYPLTVVVRPPMVVPGIARVEVLLGGEAKDVTRVHVQPVTYASKDLGAPVPDELRRSGSGQQFFTGDIWFMASGSYSVRVKVEGARGSGEFNVPVPSIAQSTTAMSFPMAMALFALMSFLVVGAVSVVGAAVREAKLPPGIEPSPDDWRRSRRAAMFTAGLAGALLWFGNYWWTLEAQAYSNYMFKPLQMVPVVNGQTLSLELKDPGWLNRRADDLVEDHGHLMHLFAIRVPDLDAFYHLHPEPVEGVRYQKTLPALPAGRYKLFGEVVHQSGLPETMVAETQLPEIASGALQGDDSALNVTHPDLRVEWLRPAELITQRPVSLKFRVTDAAGNPAHLEPYMGMAGHLVVARRDLAVLAHLHPMGTVPMASLQAFEKNAAVSHAGHHFGPEVAFPYGFPRPGSYRLWVQVKRDGKVHTTQFDCEVK